MTNPLTPSFPMEIKKEENSFKRYVEKLTTPIFNKVLQETKKDSMTTMKDLCYLWQPHNYRLLIPFKQPFKKKVVPPKVLFYRVKYTERTNKLTFKSGKGMTIEVNPKTVVIMYSSKKWYELRGTLEEINNKIKYTFEDIERKCIKEVSKIISKYGGSIDLENRRWIRHEDKIKGDEFLDTLPKDLIVHDTTFKKVYTDSVEFKSPVYMKRFINNRALDMVAPQIVEAINNNTNQLKDWTKAVQLEIKNKKLHMKVLHDMSRTLQNIDHNLLRTKYQGRKLSKLERLLIK